jgi:diguanylate cyclase (GGDEF)-like protein
VTPSALATPAPASTAAAPATGAPGGAAGAPGAAATPDGAATHPRVVGWWGATALAVGGSNQSLFILGALMASQGTGAIPLLIIGLLLSWAALPGWIELVLMWPNRVGGICATCAEAFRPYSPVLANLTGVSYWWGWIPTCGLTAILSASAMQQWFLPGIPVEWLATAIVLTFMAVNLCGIRWVSRLARPLAACSVLLAFGSAIIPVLAGSVDWHRAADWHLHSPFPGGFGWITSAMAGLYLIGFAAPAFEAAACHVGEMRDPVKSLPRAMYASAGLASLYFVALPVIWLGVLGPGGLAEDLTTTLGPTFGPLLGAGAKSAAIGFMVLNMFHGTLQPLAGAARTMYQLGEDGLLPRILTKRNRADAPWFATVLTAGMAIAFLIAGDPLWVVAAANFCYLIAIGLPSIAAWLLRRDAPHMERPYRAPRGTVTLGAIAACCWGLSTLLGFQQFGLPTVLAGLGMAYSGSIAYAWRKWSDRREARERGVRRSLHLKLAGAMIGVMVLDGGGYLLAVSHVDKGEAELVSLLSDIFVAVALLTVAVGLVLPGIISHATQQVAQGADRLARGTLADFTRAMQALSQGRLREAHASVEVSPVHVRARDEVGQMAASFNLMLDEISRATIALDGAREGLRTAESNLKRNIDRQAEVVRLGQRALEGVELERLMEETVTCVARILEAETVVILEHSDTGLRVRSAVGDESLAAAADANADLVLSEAGAGFYTRRASAPDGGEVTELVAGIHGAGTPFGQICCRVAGDRAFSQDEFDFLQAIAILLADALARRHSEDEIRHQALHDPLTGLPNRSLVMDRLRIALAHAKRRGTLVAVLFMDCDRFKLVNDSLGHATGDELLRQVGARLDPLMRGGDTLARFGGDEFIVICEDLERGAEADAIARRLIEALRMPFIVEGDTELFVSASVGIAISQGNVSEAEALVSEADAAMYRAKRSGGGHVEKFDEVMRGDATSQLRLESDLARAIENSELRLVYQPIVALRTGRAVGVEALLRWDHPLRGFINPEEFIPLAESNGMIVAIGEWVLRQACADAARWRAGRAPGTAPTVAVNLSQRQFAEPGLLNVVTDALARAELDARALQLEITESAMMDHTDTTLDTLNAIRELGVAIHLDDFGTGYSSLSYLSRFPIDALKIDRSFVAALDQREDAKTIIAAIINMAASLKVEVIAEGIETREQADTLRQLKCRQAQGFFYARPVPAATVGELLDAALPVPVPAVTVSSPA